MVLTFDTQQIYRSLSNKGNFTDAQAQTLTDALRDVASLNIEHLASNQELLQVEERLTAKLDLAVAAIDDNERRVESRLRELEQRLVIKLGGMMVVGLGVIVAFQQILGG